MVSSLSSRLAVLALASAAAAHPHRGYHHHPAGSGAPYPFPAGNATGVWGSASALATGSSSSDQFTSTVSLTSTVVQTVAVTVYPVEASGAAVSAAAAGVCSSRSTYTATETNRVTVTVTPSASGASTKSTVCTKKTKSTDSVAAAATPAPSSASSAEPVSPSSFVLASSASSSSSSVQAEATSAAPSSSSSSSSSSAPAPSVYETPAASSAPAVSSVASSAAAAPSSSTGYGSGSGSGKRGLAYNDASLTKYFTGNSKISWAYNWGQSSSGLAGNWEYVPMLWSTRSDFTGSWEKNVKAAIDSGSKHVLAFNEPDLAAQANMSPSDAAQGYKQYIQPLKSSHPDVRLGSPAVTNGANGMGLDWLSSFLNACSGCSVDFVAIHWYDSAEHVDYFKSHVQEAHEKTGKPVWITEFGASGSDEQVASFLGQVLPWLDSQDYVERYSYFMVASGKLVSGSQLSSYGQAYAS